MTKMMFDAETKVPRRPSALALQRRRAGHIQEVGGGRHEGPNSWIEHHDRGNPEDDDPYGPAAGSPSWTGWIHTRHQSRDAAERALEVLGELARKQHAVAIETYEGLSERPSDTSTSTTARPMIVSAGRIPP